jgi:hypothetical protein
MNKASGLSVTKPASVWNKAKSIKADFSSYVGWVKALRNPTLMR